MSAPFYAGSRLLGCLVDRDSVDFVWRAAATTVERRKRDGLEVAPHLTATVEALRQAAHLTPPPSLALPPGTLTTRDVAEQLRCTPRYGRRIALEAGVRQISRGVWPPDTLERIADHRRDKWDRRNQGANA